MNKIKSEGQVFTPAYIVKDMLDFVGYKGAAIIRKHIMENSCGDGAFLCEIVRRYCLNNSSESLKFELENYIHGIEKDWDAYYHCLINLDKVAAEFGLYNVQWDVVCDDTMEIYKKYRGKMDFVVGNPPYVRVHNMTSDVKKFIFATEGMTDQYLVFFEIGLNMLSSSGKMCYITPSSCLYSSAGANFREYVYQNRNLLGIIDLEHFQPFSATTYTMISLFDNSDALFRNSFAYYRYSGPNDIVFIADLDYKDAFIKGKIYLARQGMLQGICDMESHYFNNKNSVVKNGFATLADDIFIGDFPDAENIINVIKSSTGEWKKCIFPYTPDGMPLPEAQIRKNKFVWEHLLRHRERLQTRAIMNPDEWYLFGRTQALKDVSKNKIAVNQLVRDKNSLKINFVPAGCGVYSGLYIISDHTINEIEDVLISDEFIHYVQTLKNYKSGGYYTYSSAHLARFLNFHLQKRNNHELVLAFNN